jgi:hypothetical protein
VVALSDEARAAHATADEAAVFGAPARPAPGTPPDAEIGPLAPGVEAPEDAEAASANAPAGESEEAEDVESPAADPSNPRGLDEETIAEVRKLSERDAEVRTHEQAHKAVGGQFAGAINLEFTRGPDGRRYATAGHVPIDLSEESDPAATARKMEVIQRAALAPAEPSGADRAVAAAAAQKAAVARQEMVADQADTAEEPEDAASAEEATDTAEAQQSDPGPAGAPAPARPDRAIDGFEPQRPPPRAEGFFVLKGGAT